MRKEQQSFLLPDEKTYKEYKAPSQSRIKSILNGVGNYKSRSKSNYNYSRGLAIGSVVDRMLNPDIEDVSSLINIIPSKVPSGKIGDCIKDLLSGLSLEEAYKKNEFKRDSIEVVREKVEKEPYYYAMMTRILNKKITIMESDYETAINIYNSLCNHEHTAFYCSTEYPDHMEALYQVPIVFKYKGYELKALLDKIIIDHKRKVIIPIDFKTSEGSTIHFKKPFLRLKYDVQAYWYTMACKSYFNYRYSIEHNSYFKKYKVLPFVFVLESNTYQGCPLVYKVSKKTMKEAKRKVNKALSTYTWHIENNTDFKYDRVIIENKGVLVI